MKRSLLLLTLALSGCVKLETVPDVGRKVVPSGFFCSATPSEAYGSGYVYRLDRSGSELLVTDLSTSATTFGYSAVLPVYEASISRGAGLNIALLKASTSASGNLSAAGSSTSHVAFSDGRYVMMNDAGLDALLAQIGAQITPKVGSRYFVVRDTIQALGIDVRISSVDEGNLGGEAKISTLFSASPSVNFSREETLKLVSTFDKPLNVCIRAIEIQPPEVGSDGTFVPVSEGRAWLITNRAANQEDIARLVWK